jgi:FG-GAP-like repeat/Kelch motif/Galactose oxidase, central domain
MLVDTPPSGRAALCETFSAHASLAQVLLCACLLAPAALSAGPAVAQVGPWSSLAAMPADTDFSGNAYPHVYHTAHLLGNGKVLVTGGAGGFGPTSLLYNPATRTWAEPSNDAQSRHHHIGETLVNGKVLVAGGGPGVRADAELFDPTTNLWSATGSMGTMRTWFSSVRLGNGKVLVMGGKKDAGDPLASAELYDPATGQWTATGSMVTGRYFFSAVLLNNGKVLVAGGAGNTAGTQFLSSAELYDPATGLWSATGAMTGIVVEPRMVKLTDGRVLIAGGKDELFCTWDAEIYNPATGLWSPVARMRHARGGYHTLTLMPDGRVLAIGGVAPSNSPFFNSAEVYDPINNVWTLTGPLAAERAGHTATLLPNGQVLVAGGSWDQPGQDDFVNIPELYRSYLPRTVTDFNGDGKSDIVFENGAGVRWLYRMNGKTVQSTSPLPGASPGWSLVGMGDFDGNNSVDLLWRNDADPSRHWIYLMSNQTIIASAPLAVGAGYRATFIADFNADGKADIVWENNANGRWLYTMNGTAVSASLLLPGAAAGYKLVGVGDFNGDGRADMLWQNALNHGNHFIYLMNANTIIGGGAVAVAVGYLPTQIADFNGDGKDDILWENRFGSRWFYFMNGANVSQTKLAPTAASGWTLVGAADFDNNGSADLLWQNSAHPNAFWIYLMTSGNVTGGGALSVGNGYLPLTR